MTTTTNMETANSVKPVSLIPEQLMDVLKFLADKGSIRQLDYQFARFIEQQATSHSQEIGFLACVVSHELGKGHICTQLIQAQTADLAQLLGLYGETALQLNQKLLGIDWVALLQSSSLVGTTKDCVKPLMFDGQRVYLQRYWNYEVVLADTLNRLSKPVEFNTEQKKALTETLSQLFARSYHFLFNALAKAEANQQTSQVLRQQLVCDHLDIVDEQVLDWGAIDQAIVQVKQVTDLDVLDGLVPLSACLNWQKVAAAVALSRRFAVISGGPGTGKTTTVTKLLSAMVEQSLSKGKTPTIKLVAPTGKAAARLTESIGKAIEQLPLAPEVKANIPTESSTLHRLLGAIPNRAEFRHNRRNPLHLDILVVDEASMVDLSMMYKLVDALPEHARLILLGDKDQLASVEAGAVLGDICSFNSAGYSTAQGNLIAEMTGFDAIAKPRQDKSGSMNPPAIIDSLCMLQKSYRFDARSGIGQLAKAINNGSASQVDKAFSKGFGDIENHSLSSDSYNLMLRTLVNEYGVYLNRINEPLVELETQEMRAKSALDLFGQCRLLCSIREGNFGVKGLNQRIENVLAEKKLIRSHSGELWYQGRPVMITRNDHSLGLYNGDIGICISETSLGETRLKVFFEMPDGNVKSVLPSRVPEHETAYAMTIHKSQGSEFDYVLMILPPDYTPVLTRELIYTGVTRAKHQLSVYADKAIMQRAIKQKTARSSHLSQRLATDG
ncbi:exodeoxyribonuclease V subunit alpha [Vibrio breoganii]|uniref:exodeoxyribonuclease V subunit alpha n=1 Tax=Vibrio breoganii TaxID=553239 RepID=UPI000C842036|nr:exodeoxyribonuclease V subunit alpha [Vibrio breoganii]PMG99844.1 exodeoxyribonuclease V subunit alpha [Vibrio breoganii]TKG27149.1 exodeoxyribonuclease V subunit alpha [Vibrio breoganii]